MAHVSISERRKCTFSCRLVMKTISAHYTLYSCNRLDTFESVQIFDLWQNVARWSGGSGKDESKQSWTKVCLGWSQVRTELIAPLTGAKTETNHRLAGEVRPMARHGHFSERTKIDKHTAHFAVSKNLHWGRVLAIETIDTSESILCQNSIGGGV